MRKKSPIFLSLAMAALLAGSAFAALQLPIYDTFPSGAAQRAWVDYDSAYDSIEAFSPAAPGGDGYVMTVSDGSGWQKIMLAGDEGELGDYTVEAWIFVPSETTNWSRVGIFGRAQSADWDSACYYIFCDSDGDNYLRVGKYTAGHAEWENYLDGGAITRDAWHKFSLTLQGAKIVAKIDDAVVYSGNDATAFSRGYAGILSYQSNASAPPTRADRFRLLSAATTGYVYYAGGGVPDGNENTDFDGTLTGDNGVFSVLVGDVDIESGAVTRWRYATSPSNKLSGHDTASGYSWMFLENNVHAYNGFLYVGPGDWNGDSARATADLVAYAPIQSNGTLGDWAYSTEIGNDQAICATGIADLGFGNAYYYVLGGTSGYLSTVNYAKINEAGSLGAWQTTTALPLGQWFNRATVIGSTIIHGSGNQSTERHSHYATINSADGTLGNWNDGGLFDTRAGGVWDYAMCNATSAGGNSFAIILSGRDANATAGTGGNTREVRVSQVTAGVPGAWSDNTETNPQGYVRHNTAVGADDLVITMGGTEAGNILTATSEVFTGRIADNGQITWNTTPYYSIQPRGLGGMAFWKAEIVQPAATQGSWILYE